jgi:hypothetical protein
VGRWKDIEWNHVESVFLAQLESHRMERLRKTFSSNWNQVEWKDIERDHSERLLAQTGIR